MSRLKSFASAKISVTNQSTGRGVRSKGRAKVFVDSGATITILPERALKSLEATGPLEKSDAQFMTANGVKDAITVHNLSVCVDKVCYKGDILVSDGIEGDILLGTDFLAAKKCKLDFDQKSRGMKCGSKNIPFNLE